MDKHEIEEMIKNLDPEAHKSLIGTLKERLGHSGEETEVGSPTDPFAKIFNEAADALNSKYIGGTINHIRKHHPSLYGKIKGVEDELNKIWKAGLEGDVNHERFRDILDKWQSLYIKSIEIYQQEVKEEKNDRIE